MWQWALSCTLLCCNLLLCPTRTLASILEVKHGHVSQRASMQVAHISFQTWTCMCMMWKLNWPSEPKPGGPIDVWTYVWYTIHIYVATHTLLINVIWIDHKSFHMSISCARICTVKFLFCKKCYLWKLTFTVSQGLPMWEANIFGCISLSIVSNIWCD